MNSNIHEFDELNSQISLLTEKVKSDYQNLKQFTENISHEIQTPLAIMQVKIENIINEIELDKKSFAQIGSLQQDIYRLKQLNKRITLLAKIENNQFSTVQKIDINQVMDETVKIYTDLFNKHIDYTIIDPLIVEMDPYLAEILCNNLISNALKHSPGFSKVFVESKSGILSVLNQGNHPLKHPEKMFKRYYKESAQKNSMGLGLGIIKKICVAYNFKVEYKYDNQQHIFQINFQT